VLLLNWWTTQIRILLLILWNLVWTKVIWLSETLLIELIRSLLCELWLLLSLRIEIAVVIRNVRGMNEINRELILLTLLLLRHFLYSNVNVHIIRVELLLLELLHLIQWVRWRELWSKYSLGDTTRSIDFMPNGVQQRQ